MEWLRAIAGDMRCGSPCRMSDRGIANCFGVPGIRSWLSAACLLPLGVWENSEEASVFFVRFCVGKVRQMAHEEVAVLRK